MSIESALRKEAWDALEPHLFLLPTATQRKIRLAQSAERTGGMATSEELAAILGTHNWVIARRTPRIIEKYGKDVLCLSPKQYDIATRKAIESRF